MEYFLSACLKEGLTKKTFMTLTYVECIRKVAKSAGVGSASNEDTPSPDLPSGILAAKG